MTTYLGNNRFRTAPPASISRGANVVDSYTGFLWCAAGLHLLTPERQGGTRGCRSCNTRTQRIRRRSKR